MGNTFGDQIKGVALMGVVRTVLKIAYPLSRMKRRSALVSLISVGWLPHFNVFDSDYRLRHTAALSSDVPAPGSHPQGERGFSEVTLETGGFRDPN
jgi:hypothetical protein